MRMREAEADPSQLHGAVFQLLGVVSMANTYWHCSMQLSVAARTFAPLMIALPIRMLLVWSVGA